MVDLIRDRADSDKLRDGAWVTIQDFADVKIRKWRNKEHTRELVRLYDLKREELGLSAEAEMPDEVNTQVNIEAACVALIVDWRDVTSNGEPVPYTPGTAMEVLSDESWEDVFADIVNAANARANYLAEKAGVAVKNA